VYYLTVSGILNYILFYLKKNLVLLGWFIHVLVQNGRNKNHTDPV